MKSSAGIIFTPSRFDAFKTCEALVTVCAVLAAATIAFAQTGGSQPSPPIIPRIERYYEQPFDVPAFLQAWENAGRPGTDAVLGFLAGVLARQPDQTAKVAGVTLERPGQLIVVQALRFAQKTDEAKAYAEKRGWSADEIARIAPVRPLLAIRPEEPSHFDTFWGASFATGDAAYVRPIYDYYAGALSEPDIDVNDIVTIVVSRTRPNKEATDAIVTKYPRERLRWVVFASTALWSLESNARQHAFVAAALDQYVKEAPASPAAKGLAAVRAAMSRAAPPR
jgi:hypothetical protein